MVELVKIFFPIPSAVFLLLELCLGALLFGLHSVVYNLALQCVRALGILCYDYYI